MKSCNPRHLLWEETSTWYPTQLQPIQCWHHIPALDIADSKPGPMPTHIDRGLQNLDGKAHWVHINNHGCRTNINSSNNTSSTQNHWSKGNKFILAKEVLLCHSYFAISWYYVTNIQRNKDVLWTRIQETWNYRKPQTIEERAMRSLEIKWGTIKHDISKFHGIYLNVKAFNFQWAGSVKRCDSWFFSFVSIEIFQGV